MSRVLVEHPVLFIENLLKLGIGDKGRLLYLKNALKNGCLIHDSDKRFLKKMQHDLDKFGFRKGEKSFEIVDSNYLTGTNSPPYGTKSKSSIKKENSINKKNPKLSGKDSDIQKIQTKLSELKQSDSKLMDNLELLLLSRVGFSQPKIENSNSYGFLQNYLKVKIQNDLIQLKKSLLKNYTF